MPNLQPMEAERIDVGGHGAILTINSVNNQTGVVLEANRPSLTQTQSTSGPLIISKAPKTITLAANNAYVLQAANANVDYTVA